MTLSPVLQAWLAGLSLYGWIWIIPILERLFPMRGQKLLRPGILNDLAHTYHPLQLWIFLYSAFAAWVAAYAQQHGGSTLPLQGALANAHWAWNLLALFLIGHTTFYGAHFLSHKIPMLWQFHRVHHSSQTLDSFSTSRFHIFDKTLFAFPGLMLIAYFQPDPGLTFLYVSFSDFWGRYGHGNIRDAHWLGYFLSNPKFHRWHHSNHPEAIDKNFSAEFNFLDYLFGTAYYPKEGVPDNFGESGYSNNIVVQHYRPFHDCYKIVKKDGWMALLRKPKSKTKPESNAKPDPDTHQSDTLNAVHE